MSIEADFDELLGVKLPAQPHGSRVTSGAAFILDDHGIELAPRWGRRDGEVAWQRHEPLLIVGPTGVGKTTLVGQLLGGLLGTWPEVLGLPVEPAERPMLFALDRPLQIMRALRRCFGEEHRQALERLVVWRGPLPADVGKRPEILTEIALEHGADVAIFDSVKDLTAKVSDDECGSNVNKAFQMLVAENIDVCAPHHQRKGQDGRRPKTLEDVYGSTWLTAGAGSVILLWGDAGSELVDLEHLKQPADPIGPWKLEHDHHAGRTTVLVGFDCLTFLRHQPGGATVAEAAQAQWSGTPTDAQRKKTERTLRRLERENLVFSRGQAQGTSGRFTGARYYPADHQSTVDTTVDTTHLGADPDAPWTTVDAS